MKKWIKFKNNYNKDVVLNSNLIVLVDMKYTENSFLHRDKTHYVELHLIDGTSIKKFFDNVDDALELHEKIINILYNGDNVKEMGELLNGAEY